MIVFALLVALAVVLTCGAAYSMASVARPFRPFRS